MRFLKNTHIEILNRYLQRGLIRHALFDFDGTISLIREGWPGVMSPLMVEILLETPNHESEAELNRIVAQFVDRTTGQQTLQQMMQFCNMVRERGGEPLQPLEYKRRYLDRLWEHIKDRVVGLENGKLSAQEMMVPGSLQMLDALRHRGINCHLASGTDELDVQNEAEALGLTEYFGGIHGALDNRPDDSKQMVIERIIGDNQLSGPELVTFGDGYVEIEDTKAAGGIAVGVASDEAKRQGINEWKRRRLIEAGADIIIPDFREHDQLVAYLFAED